MPKIKVPTSPLKKSANPPARNTEVRSDSSPDRARNGLKAKEKLRELLNEPVSEVREPQ